MASRRRGQGDVVAAALELLDTAGLEAVTLREVARRLDAHLNTVSFQVKTKARLFELMADAVMGDLTLEDLPQHPTDRVKEILRRYRKVLLSRRDGARLVAGTNVVERNTLRVGEAIVAALLEAGVDRLRAARAFWGLHYLLLGLVEEEQASTAEADERFAAEVTSGGYPALSEAKDILLGDSFDDRFEFAMESLLRHARAAD